MRAMQYRAYGEAPSLVDIPRPPAGPGKVLVRVMASSVNPVDWKQHSGKLRLIMPNKLPCIPGYDLSGVVEEVGPGVTGFTAGDRVHTRLKGESGGSAELASCALDVLTRMPEKMDFETGAGLPLAGMTALQALRDDARLPMQGATQRVLVVGASGGVGHLAVQIARAAGAHVTGVSSAKNAALVGELGAQATIDYTQPDAFKGKGPFEIILDCVAGDPGKWLDLLTPDGSYVSTMPGPATMLRQAANALTKRRVRGTMLDANAADLRFLDGLFEAGKLRVVVDSRHPLEKLGDAWSRSQSGRAVGKIIVLVGAA